jgi:hypothetical protein
LQTIGFESILPTRDQLCDFFPAIVSPDTWLIETSVRDRLGGTAHAFLK